MGFSQSQTLVSSALIILLLACNCVSCFVIPHKKSDMRRQQPQQHHHNLQRHETQKPTDTIKERPSSNEEMAQGLKWRNRLEPLDVLDRAELIAKEKDLFDKNLHLVFKLMDQNRKLFSYEIY